MSGPRAGLLLALALPGCVVTTVAFGEELPPRDVVASIRPGMTTTREVLARLGPPDEYARPGPFARLRAFEPNTTRVLEERELFGRRRWTWDREVREQARFEAFPFFRYVDTDVGLERVTVAFDASGVVTHVADSRAGDAR